MEYKTGNLLNQINTYDYFLVTTNSFIKKDGSLVMGRGFAAQVRDAFPGLSKIFGETILKTCGHLGFYGLIFHGKFGAFQVKYHYMQPAEIELVRRSTELLITIANRQSTKLFGMNCPAIGNGKLHIDIVHPIIQTLPNNVHVWRN